MKTIFALLFLIHSLYAHQGIFQSVDAKEAILLQKGEEKSACPLCGMDLPMFYKTSHAIKLKSGEYKQYCSLNCMVEDMELESLKERKKEIAQILVVDAKSLQLIDAKSAFYVYASKKPGTMSIKSKYAFKQLQEAQKFQKQNGGELLDFQTIYARTLQEFAR
jgi:copper chaperone NosL